MKLIKRFTRIWAVALALTVSVVCEAANVELLQSSIVDDEALNFSSASATFNRNINGRTYQRDPMVTFKGYQYAIYYNGGRRVCIGRRKLPAGDWDVITFTDYTINGHDSHNVAAIGICEKDGTIHMAYDHHGGALHYRVSDVGVASDPEGVEWSTDRFGATTDRLGSAGRISGLTYPSFFRASNGNLMLYYRSGGSGNGDGMIQEYNGTAHDWTAGLGKFISRSGTYNGDVSNGSTSRCPYINGISYGGTRLHASWGWRESASSSNNNHDLNYAYSDDHGRTWYNNAGTQIGTTGSSSISINSPGLIVAPIPQNIGLSNQYTHYAYPDGSCHVIVVHNGKYQHYWRNAAGVWSHGTLSFSGSRPKLTGDDDGNLFLVYTSSGKPRIAKGVPNAAKTAWSWSSVYTQNISEGGEGKLDYTRWESERVLSIYGQEQPSDSGETPSPLHVFDYRVSTKATQPDPAHGAVVKDFDAGLSWSAGLGGVSHQVYFGTDQAAVATATTSSPEYQGQQSGSTFVPSPVPSDQGTYYWRIDEVQANSTVVTGLVWEVVLNPDSYWAPVAHWPLDEGAGTVAEDISGNDYAGALDHGASWGSDITRNTYVTFDGNDDRISTPFTYALSSGHDFTWAWWAKKEPGATGGSVMVGSRYGNTGSEKYEFIKFTPDGAQFANSAETVDIERYDYADIPNSEWHHYAMVKSGTNYQWYVDGAAQGSTNLNYSETTPIPFRIGGDIDDKPNECFEGAIDDVVLYRRALTSAEVENVKEGIYEPIITMVALGSAEDLTEGATWSDGLPAHDSSQYIVPDTGNLRSENGNSIFPGTSLTVEAGGKFQFRAKHELGESTTVENLIATGGTSGQSVNLAAGTGNNTINHLDGTLINDGFTTLSGYGSATGPRNIRISSHISGSGTLHSTGTSDYPHTCTIANADNTFSGVWESHVGMLEFENAGAIGAADVDVLDGGKLKILGNWRSEGSLTVSDSTTTEVDLGVYTWSVSNVVFGGASLEDGNYDSAELNALGSNPVFTGSGILRVGAGDPIGPIAHWKLDEGAGTIAADASGNGHNGTMENGVGWGSDATRASYASFDGTDDRIVTDVMVDITAAYKDFTWAYWVNNQMAATNAVQKNGVIVGNRYPALGSDLHFMKQTPTQQEVRVGDANQALNYDDLPVGVWHHCAVVKSGSTLTYYRDGVEVASRSLTTFAPAELPFFIGGDPNTGNAAEHFNGFVDDVVLYELALTSNEVVDVKNGIYGSVDPVEPPVLDYGMSDGHMVFDWTGSGFKVQSCTNLTDGAWEDVPGGDTPPVTNSTTDPEAFFRLIEQ